MSFLFSKQLLFQGAKHRIYIFLNFFSFFLKIFLLPHTRNAQPCDILCGNRNSAVRRFFVSLVCISKNFAVCTIFFFVSKFTYTHDTRCLSSNIIRFVFDVIRCDKFFRWHSSLFKLSQFLWLVLLFDAPFMKLV